MNFKRKLSFLGIRAIDGQDDAASNLNDLGAEGQADAIADLLVGGGDGEGQTQEEESEAAPSESEDENEGSEDSEEEETPSEESTEESSDESDDDDTTWENVLGVDEGQLNFDEEGNLSGVNVKVNGESSTVKVNDLIMGYQNNKANTLKAQGLAEERKAFDAQAGQVAQEYKSKLENVETMTNFLSDKLVSEFNGIDWDRLRVDNPAEYAAARQDYATRANELQQAQEAIKGERENATAGEQQKMVQARQAYLREEHGKMLNNNPTWNNPEVLSKDMGNIKTFLNSQYGFTDQDFAQVGDSRIIELAKDAKAFREGVKFAKKKIAKPVPKFHKSTGKSRKAPSKLDKLTKTAKSATGSNKRVAQANAVAEILMGGS